MSLDDGVEYLIRKQNKVTRSLGKIKSIEEDSPMVRSVNVFKNLMFSKGISGIN